jgi:serine protease
MTALSLLRRFTAALTLTAAWVCTGPAAGAAAHGLARHHPAARYVAGQVVVGLRGGANAALARDIAGGSGISGVQPRGSSLAATELVRVPSGRTVAEEAALLRRLPGVAYAVPDYIAHAAGQWFPDDKGRAHTSGDWTLLQWNFLAGAGVDVPAAWGNLFADGAGGGAGVTVAILDTGVAFENWHGFHISPDFTSTRFVSPCDLIAGRLTGLGRGGAVTASTRCTNTHPVDRQGHGTFVAGVVAESTNNSLGVTGIAYGASIMPVRVLDAMGDGDSLTIARGIRYAVAHGARVINLSLEFDLTIQARDIPDVVQAVDYATRHGVLVVAASGNDDAEQIAYPARYPPVVSVGATTRDRCLAIYSNTGNGLDLVAPGGGDDASLPDPNCHPERNLPDVYQMTFGDPSTPDRFSLPGGWYGTSMAAPHVAAVAALVDASGVLGANPSASAVLTRLEETAQPLGSPVPNANYGYGLIDAAAATAGVSQIARTHRPSSTTVRTHSRRRTATRRA